MRYHTVRLLDRFSPMPLGLSRLLAMLAAVALLAGTGLGMAGCQGGASNLKEDVGEVLDNYAVHRNRGFEQYRAGDFRSAAESFKAAADRRASDVASHYWWAVSLINLGQFADAQLPLEQAWAIAPDTDTYTPRILDRLAEVYFQQGRTEKLYGFLEEAVVRYGRLSRDYQRKAYYLTKSGDLDGAKLALIKAANFAERGDAMPYITLADFYESVNQPAKARTALRYAYFINPEIESLAGRLSGYGVVLGPSAGLQPPTPLQVD